MTDDKKEEKKGRSRDAGELAVLSLLAALAIILGYVEVVIPFDFVIPGVKPGLCNIVIIMILMYFSWREAVIVSFVRILAVGFMFGNLFSISYSIAGSLLAILIMTLLIRIGRFGFIGISVSGAAMHGIGQLIIAKAVLPALPFAGYASLLIISGVVTGSVTGFISFMICRRLGSFC